MNMREKSRYCDMCRNPIHASLIRCEECSLHLLRDVYGQHPSAGLDPRINRSVSNHKNQTPQGGILMQPQFQNQPMQPFRLQGLLERPHDQYAPCYGMNPQNLDRPYFRPRFPLIGQSQPYFFPQVSASWPQNRGGLPLQSSGNLNYYAPPNLLTHNFSDNISLVQQRQPCEPRFSIPSVPNPTRLPVQDQEITSSGARCRRRGKQIREKRWGFQQ
ncbi:Hypothetical predicted protein [Cloeon dipterum]|uniref:Uncharacterized protein n=1 Tax=Cloeon dipterum TaxID=197152 RepID=A0A8S1DXW6_9INSE|nr:Hypothetical predicted protein [Cloeon dipterum]